MMNKLINISKGELNENLNLQNNPSTTLPKLKASSTLNKLLFDLSHDNISLLESCDRSKDPEEPYVLNHKKQ